MSLLRAFPLLKVYLVFYCKQVFSKETFLYSLHHHPFRNKIPSIYTDPYIFYYLLLLCVLVFILLIFFFSFKTFPEVLLNNPVVTQSLLITRHFPLGYSPPTLGLVNAYPPIGSLWPLNTWVNATCMWYGLSGSGILRVPLHRTV